jgi:hypothetical protein
MNNQVKEDYSLPRRERKGGHRHRSFVVLDKRIPVEVIGEVPQVMGGLEG